MEIVFRTDASLQIGSGHVMRCLTLARALRSAGAICRFVCREHPGNMLDFIRQQGFDAVGLPMNGVANDTEVSTAPLSHEAWLACDWRMDAIQTEGAIGNSTADWMVVDHYAIDIRWESSLRHKSRRLMVIDDLADRRHVADLLLDQNMVESMDGRYVGLLPEQCIAMIGPRYALLRPEFSAHRADSLLRRLAPKMDRLLIFLGGSDVKNDTGKVIKGVQLARKRWLHIDVVVGQGFPALPALHSEMSGLANSKLHIQTPHMAKLMRDADLAITASGSVTWEKCTLGLPSLVVIQGGNQYPIASLMGALGAHHVIGSSQELSPERCAKHLDNIDLGDMKSMTELSSKICDGTGVDLVLKVIEVNA